MSLKDSLCAVELFCELPDDLVDEMIARGSTVEVGPGVEMVAQGDHSTGMYLILDGSADVTVDGHPVGRLAKGDYFGEMSLIDGETRSATVTSGPDGATAFRLSAIAFSELIAQHPHTALLLLKGLAGRVRALEARLR
jgi:CRP/FNR family cyclic AMP-dependent transcriptional regulator